MCYFGRQVELSFRTGDILYVYGQMDPDGFYMGEFRGKQGLVPSNFLQVKYGGKFSTLLYMN